MTTKYHVSTKTHKVGECHATKRKCRYGTHYSNEAAAQTAADRSAIAQTRNELEKRNQPAPITTPATNLKEPGNVVSLYFEGDEAGDHYTNDTHYAVHYTYDYYGRPWGSGWDDDNFDMVRDNVYEGLQVDKVNVRNVLANIYRCNADDIPETLVEKAKELKWDDPESYDVWGEGGYYGEEVAEEIPADMGKKAREMYWELPNANDREGILNYVRGKGFDTTGKTPVQAILAQLKTETHLSSRAHKLKATKATVGNVKIANIIVPQGARWNQASAVKPETTLPGGKNIVGVLYKDERSNYYLMDGYSRTKYQMDALNRKTGDYIILSK